MWSFVRNQIFITKSCLQVLFVYPSFIIMLYCFYTIFFSYFHAKRVHFIHRKKNNFFKNFLRRQIFSKPTSFNAIQFTVSHSKNFIMLFFLFLVILSNFLIIPVVKEKIKVKLAPAIPIGAPTTLTEKIIQTPPLFAEIITKVLSM